MSQRLTVEQIIAAAYLSRRLQQPDAPLTADEARELAELLAAVVASEQAPDRQSEPAGASTARVRRYRERVGNGMKRVKRYETGETGETAVTRVSTVTLPPETPNGQFGGVNPQMAGVTPGDVTRETYETGETAVTRVSSVSPVTPSPPLDGPPLSPLALSPLTPPLSPPLPVVQGRENAENAENAAEPVSEPAPATKPPNPPTTCPVSAAVPSAPRMAAASGTVADTGTVVAKPAPDVWVPTTDGEREILAHYRSRWPKKIAPDVATGAKVRDFLARGVSPKRITLAIDGNALDPWARKTGNTSLSYLVRDTETLDKWASVGESGEELATDEHGHLTPAGLAELATWR